MGTFIIVGYRQFNAEPECLYIGSDGVKAQQVSVEARESGHYVRLVRHVNPVGTPLPPKPFGNTSVVGAMAGTPVVSAVNVQPKKKTK